MTQATGAELWRLASSGRPEAFGDLFERHAAAVYNHCFRRTADWSLAQDLPRRSAFRLDRGFAALYEVAARLPGVELVGSAIDPSGRRGVAVAMANAADGIRHMLIFDPETADLLAEEQRTLEGNEFGYPEGTLIGYATYERPAVVDSDRERPRD